MRHTGQIVLVLVVGIFCLAGNVLAQQSRSAPNANIKGRVAESTGARSLEQPLAPPGYLESPSTFAILGAVRKPGVYTTTLASVSVGWLIESAGGFTTDSIETVRIYDNGKARTLTQVGRVLTLPVQDGQVVYVAPRGGESGRRLSVGQDPYRPVVITGLGTKPLLLNLGNKSQDVEGLVLMLGQPREVMGDEQFMAVCPQRQWLAPSDFLQPNTIIHFPPESVRHEGVRAAIQNGLEFEPLMLISATIPSPEVTPSSQAPPPPATATPFIPPAARPQAPGKVPAKLPTPPATSELLPGALDPQIEPAGSSVPSQEPLRLPRYDEIDEELEESAPAPPENATGRPPIMMRPEWSNFGEETGEELDQGRKIERTSAGRARFDQEIVLAAAETATTVSPVAAEDSASEPVLEQAPPPPVPVAAADTQGPSIGIESWIAIAVTLGVAALSVLVSGVLSREERTSSLAIPLSETPALEESTEAEAASREAQEDRRFLQRLIVNQIPLVEEEPTLPHIDQLHGIVIGNRRMVVHEAHEGVPGPHFAVREANDTRPLERRLRTVLRETATGPRRTDVAVAAESSHVRTSVSPLERALRHVDRGGQR